MTLKSRASSDEYLLGTEVGAVVVLLYQESWINTGSSSHKNPPLNPNPIRGCRVGGASFSRNVTLRSLARHRALKATAAPSTTGSDTSLDTSDRWIKSEMKPVSHSATFFHDPSPHKAHTSSHGQGACGHQAVAGCVVKRSSVISTAGVGVGRHEVAMLRPLSPLACG